MSYVYAMPGESAQTTSDTELQLDGFILMNSSRPVGDYVASHNGEWVEVKSVEAEREWRNKELKLVASQECLWKYNYGDLVRAYMQELADYTDTDLSVRPQRPLTEKGNDIII